MRHEITTNWKGGMQFDSLVNGHTLTLDAHEEFGGKDLGPTPKPLILTALSGCTGMDVVAMLRNRKIELDEFNLEVSGNLTEKHPKEYTDMHVIYRIKGNEADEKRTLRAIQASQTKICGVASLLKKAIPVTWSVIYNGKEVFNNA